MKKLLVTIFFMFLAFFPVQALSKPTVCEAHAVSNYQIFDKHYITYEVTSTGGEGFRLFLKDPFNWPAHTIVSGDGPYHGIVSIVIDDYHFDRYHLAIQCK